MIRIIMHQTFVIQCPVRPRNVGALFFQFFKLHETPCIFGKIPAESPYPGNRIVSIVNKGLEIMKI